jgi:hypothetical protein
MSRKQNLSMHLLCLRNKFKLGTLNWRGFVFHLRGIMRALSPYYRDYTGKMFTATTVTGKQI